MSNSKPLYNNNNLRVLYWNACTFNYNKWNQLQIYLNNQYNNNNSQDNIIHIICISEAKLTNSALNTTQSLSGKFGSYIRYYYPCELDLNDTSSNGGGLLFYIHSTIHIEECNSLSLAVTSPDLLANDKLSTDVRWIQFEYGKNIKFTLGSIYLHPTASNRAVDCCINNIKNCMEYTNGPILIAGDFNLKHPLWSKQYGVSINKSAESLVEFIDQHDLTLLNIIYAKHQVTLKPFAMLRAESVVDLALTNQPKFISQMNVLKDSGLFSDHNPIDIHIINYSNHQRQNNEIHKRKQEKWRSSSLNKEHWKLYETQLGPHLSKWKDKYSQLLNPGSIKNLAIQQGKNHLQNILDDATYELTTIIIKTAEHVIEKKVIGKKYKKCFITHNGAIQSMLDETHKARDEYYKLNKSNVHNKDHDKKGLIDAKNRWNDNVKKFNYFLAEINRDEWLKKLNSVYENERLEKKLSWSNYKQTLPSTAQWTSKINNHNTNEPPINADEGNNNLARYYASICQTDSVTQQDRDPFIVQTIDNFNKSLKMEWINMINMPKENSETSEISLQEVLDFSNKINCEKAYGCDEIDGYMLRYGGLLLHSCIQLLFNGCWCSGILPVNFTSSNIFPLYKKGDIHQACNYRPISLTSCLMRLFEKILYNRAESQIKLHPSQAGFRKKHSTSDNLYRLLERIYDAMWSSSNSYGVCLPVVFLDLQKAFDKMDIPSALYKLHKAGLSINS
ncbi:MAG: reverse transcriptase domain-containing protein, partial [Nitrososphaeraceae archaeon]